MPIKDKPTLKGYFQSGLVPNESNFVDLIDSIPEGGPTGVPTTRLISTTAPLTGGGDLSADRTLAISPATTSAAGSMSAADKTKLDAILGTNTGDQTLTGLGGVPTSRTISTTAPLTGGGDLSANRTLAISAATTGAAGSMSAADKAKLDGIAAGATAGATWNSNISGQPSTFTPSAHTHAGGDITSQVANATNASFAAIATTSDMVDGYHAGNGNSQIPISNWIQNLGLYATYAKYIPNVGSNDLHWQSGYMHYSQAYYPSNTPYNAHWRWLEFPYDGSQWSSVLAFDFYQDIIMYQRQNGPDWQTWREIFHTGRPQFYAITSNMIQNLGARAVGTVDVNVGNYGCPASGVRAVVVRNAARWATAAYGYYQYVRRTGTDNGTGGVVFAQANGLWGDNCVVVQIDSDNLLRIVNGGAATQDSVIGIAGYFK